MCLIKSSQLQLFFDNCTLHWQIYRKKINIETESNSKVHGLEYLLVTGWIGWNRHLFHEINVEIVETPPTKFKDAVIDLKKHDFKSLHFASEEFSNLIDRYVEKIYLIMFLKNVYHNSHNLWNRVLKHSFAKFDWPVIIDISIITFCPAPTGSW